MPPTTRRGRQMVTHQGTARQGTARQGTARQSVARQNTTSQRPQPPKARQPATKRRAPTRKPRRGVQPQVRQEQRSPNVTIQQPTPQPNASRGRPMNRRLGQELNLTTQQELVVQSGAMVEILKSVSTNNNVDIEKLSKNPEAQCQLVTVAKEMVRTPGWKRYITIEPIRNLIVYLSQQQLLSTIKLKQIGSFAFWSLCVYLWSKHDYSSSEETIRFITSYMFHLVRHVCPSLFGGYRNQIVHHTNIPSRVQFSPQEMERALAELTKRGIYR